MKYYVLVIDGVVRENIPEWNPDLPDTPIEERYPADLLDQCIVSETEVPHGWLYDADTGGFHEPPEPDPVEVVPDPEPEPMPDPLAEALSKLAGVIAYDESIVKLVTDLDTQLTNTQLALCDVYELLVGGDL